MYKLFLTLRYLHRRRIAYFAIAAVMLGTANVLIVMSVMGGFLDQLKVKARGLLGDVIIDNRSSSGFPLYQAFISDVSAWPEVVKATPVIYSYGLLRFRGTPQTAMVRVVGLRLDDVYEVNAFKSSLYYEKYYPGTTTLAPQRQPLLGFDREAPLVTWRDEKDRVLGHIPPPILPPAYQAALRQSVAAGIVESESAPTEWITTCRAAGLPPIAGQYEPVVGMGPPEMWGDPLPGLIIGRDIIAKRLADGRYQRYWHLPRGCEASVTVVPVGVTGDVSETPQKIHFRYADDSRTGIYEIDSQHVYCDFDLLQSVLLMGEAERIDPETFKPVGVVPARCSQVQLRIAAGVDAKQLAGRLAAHYHSFLDDPRFADQLGLNERQLIQYVEALTWEESQAHIIAPVERERILMGVVLAVISVVTGALVLCILYMIALQKTRDIGILKAIGASSAGIAMVFQLYGAAMGVVGSALGAVIAYYFVTYINEIQGFLIMIHPALQVWDRAVYSFDEIPSTVRPFDVVLVVGLSIITSIVGSLAAAWRAGAMQPVEAMRHE